MHKEENLRKSLAGSLSYINGAESLEIPKVAKNNRTVYQGERVSERENAREQQKVPLVNSAEYWSSHLCEEMIQVWRKTVQKD